MELQRKTDYVSTLINEKLTGARTIRAFNHQQYEIEKLTKADEDVRDTAIYANSFIVYLTPIVQVVMNLVVVAVLCLGSVQMQSVSWRFWIILRRLQN